jgi:hypothetical protein
VLAGGDSRLSGEILMAKAKGIKNLTLYKKPETEDELRSKEYQRLLDYLLTEFKEEADAFKGLPTSCFPLCQHCWSELSPQKRIPFYKMLYNEWLKQGSPEILQTWEDIKASVLRGN